MVSEAGERSWKITPATQTHRKNVQLCAVFIRKMRNEWTYLRHQSMWIACEVDCVLHRTGLRMLLLNFPCWE